MISSLVMLPRLCFYFVPALCVCCLGLSGLVVSCYLRFYFVFRRFLPFVCFSEQRDAIHTRYSRSFGKRNKLSVIQLFLFWFVSISCFDVVVKRSWFLLYACVLSTFLLSSMTQTPSQYTQRLELENKSKLVCSVGTSLRTDTDTNSFSNLSQKPTHRYTLLSPLLYNT